MNIWQHGLLSQRKFGGQPQDYIRIHRFIDSSKLFFYHFKHRVLIHNLYGVELATDLFGDTLTNSDDKTILVRDIAAEHCREDLSNHTPTLQDWFKANDHLADYIQIIPDLGDDTLNAFIQKPYLRSGLKSTLVITCSDFGVYLMEQFLGLDAALQLAKALEGKQAVKPFLQQFKMTEPWQYTPNRKDLQYLRDLENSNLDEKGGT